MKRNLILTVLLIAIAVISVSAADTSVTWKQAESSIKTTWAKQYPNEKLISVEQNGNPRNYDKLEGGVKVYYMDYPAKVVAEQKTGKVVFEVSAVYKKSGNTYNYTGMSVGNSTPFANKGQEAPSKDEIKKLIAQAYEKANPGTKVSKVLIGPAELGKSANRWWYSLGVDIELGDGSKVTNDYVTIFKGAKGNEGVDASAAWNVDGIKDFR